MSIKTMIKFFLALLGLYPKSAAVLTAPLTEMRTALNRHNVECVRRQHELMEEIGRLGGEVTRATKAARALEEIVGR